MNINLTNSDAQNRTMKQWICFSVLAAVAALFSEGAMAQALGDEAVSFTEEMVTFLTENLAIPLATVALVIVGFLCWTGRINWGWFGALVVGILLVFNAENIVNSIADASGGGA